MTDHDIKPDEASSLGDSFTDVMSFPESQTAANGSSGTYTIMS